MGKYPVSLATPHAPDVAHALTIVIPAYNEQDRLPPTLDLLLEWRKSQSFGVEIIVVDDGSTDPTCSIVEGYVERHADLKLIRESHVGYMNAIITGLRNGRHFWRAIVEADCPVHPSYLTEFLRFTPEHQIVMGSRKLRDDSVVVEGKSLFRRFLSAGMSRLFLTLFKCRVTDPQMGFKLYSATVVESVLPRLALPHDGLKATEILVKAEAMGFKIKELPVRYKHDPASRLVPKNATVVVFRAIGALFSLWVLSYAEYRRGYVPNLPVRAAFLLAPFWRLFNYDLVPPPSRRSA